MLVERDQAAGEARHEAAFGLAVIEARPVGGGGGPQRSWCLTGQ